MYKIFFGEVLPFINNKSETVDYWTLFLTIEVPQSYIYFLPQNYHKIKKNT